MAVKIKLRTAEMVYEGERIVLHHSREDFIASLSVGSETVLSFNRCELEYIDWNFDATRTKDSGPK